MGFSIARTKKVPPKIEINTAVYKKYKIAEAIESGGPSIKFELAIKYFSTVIIALFMTPVLVITSILSKATIVILSNIGLAGCYLLSRIWNFIFRDKDWIEILTIVIGIAVVCYIMVLITPSISIASTFSLWLFKANIFASAINVFYLIEDLVVSVVKTVLEKLSVVLESWLGKKYSFSVKFFNRNALDLEHNGPAVDALLKKYSDTGQGAYAVTDGKVVEADDYEKRLEPVNKLRAKLVKYVDKNYRKFMGFVLNRAAIDRLKDAISTMSRGGGQKAIDLVEEKAKKKAFKVAWLKTKLERVSTVTIADDETDAVSYDQSLVRAFKNLPKKLTKDDLAACKKALEDEIDHQEAKIKELKECLPLSVKI